MYLANSLEIDRTQGRSGWLRNLFRQTTRSKSPRSLRHKLYRLSSLMRFYQMLWISTFLNQRMGLRNLFCQILCKNKCLDKLKKERTLRLTKQLPKSFRPCSTRLTKKSKTPTPRPVSKRKNQRKSCHRTRLNKQK